jgi:hypothetical protein
MSTFKALYGWPCCTPLSWSESGERVIFGPDIVTEAEEKVKQIHANILTVQSRQKSYINKRHCPLEFEVANHVYLRVSPMKGVCRFGIKGKVAPRYIAPYPIIDKYGPTSYQVELPSKLSGVYNVFHVSQLKRCLKPTVDLGGISHQDSRPTWPSHPQQVYSVLQGSMEWSFRKWSHVGTWGLSTIQLSWLSSVKVTNAKPHHLYRYFNLRVRFPFKGEGCNTLCYGSPNYLLITFIRSLIMH